MLKTCSVNKVPFNFFLLTLKKQTPVSLLITAFLLLICPGMLLRPVFEGYELYLYQNALYNFNHSFPSFAIIVFAVSLLAMLVLVLYNFGFLYSKKAGDMYHSLPLTKNQLFFTKTAASFIGAFFTMSVSFAFLVIINAFPFVRGITFKECGRYFLSMTVLLILCTCFTALFAILSSCFFNFIVSLGSVSAALPLIVAMIFYWVEQGYGILISRNPLIYTSPYIYAVVKLIAWDRHIDNVSLFSPVSFFLCIFFSFLFIALALLAFKKRKTETAEQPFSFKIVNFTTLICVAVCGGVGIGTVFSLGEVQSFTFWAFCLFGSLITAVAVGAITNKNFKTILKSLLLGCIAFLTVLVVFLGSKAYAAYAERFVPDFDSIESVTVNGDQVSLSDIDLVLNIHEKAIEDGFDPSAYNTEFRYEYYIEYILTSGKKVNRYYTVYNDRLNHAYLKSETRLAFYENPTIPEDTSISVYGENDKDGASYLLTATQYRKLLSLYAKDIRNSTPEVFKEEKLNINGRMTRDDYGTLYIFESYENTRAYLDYLKENGVKY